QGSLNARQKRKSVFRLALDMLIEMFNNPERNKLIIKLFHEWITSDQEPLIFVV
ncbi:MAG: hypothetical protein ACI9SQ_000194, partial [Rubritalea sp.]